MAGMTFELTDKIRVHTSDTVAWLTTVGSSGTPYPRPVWFAWHDGAFVVYSQPDTAKLRHLAANPNVAFHFNSDAGGGNFQVITATAAADASLPKASELPAFLDKYAEHIPNVGLTVDQFDASYSVAVRVVPRRSWGF